MYLLKFPRNFAPFATVPGLTNVPGTCAKMGTLVTMAHLCAWQKARAMYRLLNTQLSMKCSRNTRENMEQSQITNTSVKMEQEKVDNY